MSQAKLDALYARIKDLEDNLPYADHGAYSQDKDRIRKLYEEIKALEAKTEHEGPDYSDGPEFEGWVERSGQQPQSAEAV